MFCKVWTAVQSVFTIASFMSIHAIVALRVHALHNGARWVARILWLGGILYAASTVGVMVAASIHILPDNEPSHRACVTDIPSFLWAAWLPSVIFESMLFVLTLLAMVAHDRKRSFSSLTIILYRDGMFYFLVVSCKSPIPATLPSTDEKSTVCSMFSLLVWAFAPPTLLGLARYFALAFVNIAGSRLVLNLKTYAARNDKGDDEWDTPVTDPSSLGISPPSPQTPGDIEHGTRNTSGGSPFDIELYDIEREYQQLGTKILESAPQSMDFAL
ncbi:hypothetical protein NLI96_g7629 [Meripilus lineatus]|uniref:Uncharacterized protein n=1 Tax=Meripilus lineatus TaxID=2056292 RepID=A0AAD5YBV8_9APHY|nr:hypothetical protein NLI96_g7629 [Physisporinus lineatus]